MITTLDFRKIYTFAAGASVATYPITFTYQNALEILAELTEPDGTNVPLARGVDFSVSAGPATNGTLTKVGVWDAVATQLTIYRATPQTNTTDLVNGAIYNADTAESSVDELTQMVQELQGNRDLALVSSITDPSAPGPLPTAASRANHFLGFDASGDPIAADPTNVPVTAYMKTLLDDLAAADARTTLDVYSHAEDNALLSANRLALVKTTAVDYTILDTDGYTDIVASGTTAITLPAVANNPGRDIAIINSGTGVITIIGTVEGVVNPTLDSQYDRALISARSGVWYFKAYRSHGSNTNGSFLKLADGTMLEWGWGYLIGNGADNEGITPTYPAAFTPVSFSVSSQSIGYSTTAPVNESDTDGGTSQLVSSSRLWNNTTFALKMIAPDLSSVSQVLTSGIYFLFSFIAIGRWR